MKTRAECIAAASVIAAAAWRELHEAWISGGQQGVAAIAGEQEAGQYAEWVAEDRAERERGAA